MSRIKYKNAKKSYRPSRALVNLINGLLGYRDQSKELEDRSDAWETTEQDKDKEKVRLKKKKDSLDKRKVIVLNKHIFPALANLTVLVEAMQEESYIRGKFEDDLRELFLGKSSKRSKNSIPIFQRFIAASCTLTSSVDHRTKEKKKILAPDFRLFLLHIMQQTIYRKMEVIAKLKFNSPSFRKDKLLAEMKNATLSTEGFAHDASVKEMTEARRKKHSQTVRRPPLF